MKKNKLSPKFPIQVKTRLGRHFLFSATFILALQLGAALLCYVALPILYLIKNHSLAFPDIEIWQKISLVMLGSGLIGAVLWPLSEIIDEWNDRRKQKKIKDNQWNRDI